MEEKLYFKTSDGLKLCGILSSPKQETDKCIVLCHGITVNKDEDGIFTDLACKLCDAGFAVFRFDFRGHGESEGNSIDMTIAGETKDLKTAINLLQNRGFKEFGMVGASFAGGAVSFFVSSHKKAVKALILWNASIDYSENINPTLPWTKKYMGKPAFERVKKFGFTEVGSRGFRVGKQLAEEIKSLRPWEELKKANIPMLFIHGDKDTYVPVNDSVKYAALINNAKIKIIFGAEHGFHEKPEYSEEADKATIEFFQRYL